MKKQTSEKIIYGDDGELFLYNDRNILIARADSFSAQVIHEVVSAGARFLDVDIVTGSKIYLVLHGVTLIDSEEINEMRRSSQNGTIPVLNFQGEEKRKDKIRKRIVFRNLEQCGDVDRNGLQEGYINAWTFYVNSQEALKYFNAQ
jgi:hypothetical protein